MTTLDAPSSVPMLVQATAARRALSAGSSSTSLGTSRYEVLT
jgi:hypothetical protein